MIPGSAPHPGAGIIDYRPTPDDARISNPFLDEVMALIDSHRNGDPAPCAELLSAARAEFIGRYAFSIPTADTLGAITAVGPLVEIGAGSGYWAWCLAQWGADIIALDHRPPDEGDPWDPRGGNQWFDDTWTWVGEGTAHDAASHPDRALFLCWPPPENPMARDALAAHRAAGGRIAVFLGSRRSCADAAFFHDLAAGARLTVREHCSWPGVEERLVIARCTG